MGVPNVRTAVSARGDGVAARCSDDAERLRAEPTPATLPQTRFRLHRGRVSAAAGERSGPGAEFQCQGRSVGRYRVALRSH